MNNNIMNGVMPDTTALNTLYITHVDLCY